LGTLASAFAWDLWSLLVFRLITGFGIGGEWAAGHTLINESLPKGERGRASSLIQSGAPIGAALAAIVGGFITPTIGWRLSFIIASVPSFILVVLMLAYLKESPQFLIFRAEASDVRSKDEGKIPQGMGYVRAATKRTFGDLWIVRKKLALATMLSFWGMMAYWVIFSFLPKYLDTIGYSSKQVGYWMLLSQLGAFIGYLSFGFVVDFTKKFRGTFASYGSAFALGILVFLFGNNISSYPISLIGIFITGLGTGFFSGYGPLYSHLFPAKIRNTSASCAFNIGRLGSFAAPILVAYIAASSGFAAAISIGSIFAIILCLWVFLIPLSDYTVDNLEGIEHRDPVSQKILIKVKV
jgi:MFS family permease